MTPFGLSQQVSITMFENSIPIECIVKRNRVPAYGGVMVHWTCNELCWQPACAGRQTSLVRTSHSNTEVLIWVCTILRYDVPLKFRDCSRTLNQLQVIPMLEPEIGGESQYTWFHYRRARKLRMKKFLFQPEQLTMAANTLFHSHHKEYLAVAGSRRMSHQAELNLNRSSHQATR